MKMIFKKIKRLFNNIDKSLKYTCGCCGYKTLTDNGIGEICPVCYWEEDYTSVDDLFEYSSANNCTLYEAQENYKMFGACYKNVIKYCRKPCKMDLKDDNWISIQTRIESLHKDKLKTLQEVKLIIEKLSFFSAKAIYANFKSLPEILIFDNDSFYECPCRTYDEEIYKNQLRLKSLSICLMKLDVTYLINILISFYNKSLNYYIGWSILLSVVLSKNLPIINDVLNDLLIDIETNGFYGLSSVQNLTAKYWLNLNKGVPPASLRV